MKTQKFTVLFILALIFLYSPGDSHARHDNRKINHKKSVLFIFDASGSMAMGFGGVSRMSAARSFLLEKLGRLKTNIPVGLVAYGNGILGCTSARLYSPINQDSRHDIIKKVDHFFPSGNTPLAATLRLVGKTIIPDHPNTTIIVISDGAESCGGNPIKEAARLRSKGVKIHVIGLAVNTKDSRHLNAIATAASGKYIQINNKLDLRNAALGRITPMERKSWNRFVERKWKIYGKDKPERIVNSKPVKKLLKQEIKKNTNIHIPFIITGIKKKYSTGNKTIIEVFFKFNLKSAGNYHINIQAVLRPEKTGPNRRMNSGMLLGISGISFYHVSSGSGSVEMEIPSAILVYRPIYMQGELWNTKDVPLPLYVSNSIPAL